MSIRTRILFAAALAFAAVGSAQAQRPGGGGTGGGAMNIKSMIVTSKPLQEELKISIDQGLGVDAVPVGNGRGCCAMAF